MRRMHNGRLRKLVRPRHRVVPLCGPWFRQQEGPSYHDIINGALRSLWVPDQVIIFIPYESEG